MFFGKQIKMFRGGEGLSREDLAEMAGISVDAIIGVENNRPYQKKTENRLLRVVEKKGYKFTEKGVEESNDPVLIVNDYIEVLNDALEVMSAGDEILFRRADDRRSSPEVIQKMNDMRKAGLKFRSTISENNTFIWGEKDEYRQIPEKLFLGGDVQVIYADRYVIHECVEEDGEELDTFMIIRSEKIAKTQRVEFENEWGNGKCLQ